MAWATATPTRWWRQRWRINDGGRVSTLRRILQAVTGAKPLPRGDLTPPPPPDYTRADMDAALKAIVVPHLRALGFKGSIPHFYRVRGDGADLLTVQFSRSGGKFVVELGRCEATGLEFHGRHVPLNKANTTYLHQRHRLGSELKANFGDNWYDFRHRDPEEVAREVCEGLNSEGLWHFLDHLAHE